MVLRIPPSRMITSTLTRRSALSTSAVLLRTNRSSFSIPPTFPPSSTLHTSSRMTALDPGEWRCHSQGNKLIPQFLTLHSRSYSAVPQPRPPPEESETSNNSTAPQHSQQPIASTSEQKSAIHGIPKQSPSPQIQSEPQSNAPTSESESESESQPTSSPASLPTALLPRPIVSPYTQPFLSPSPLNQILPPEPPQAKGAIKEALADFLAAEAAGDVRPVAATHSGTWYWSTYWRIKELAKFYWAGSKLLYRNYKITRQLKTGQRLEGWKLTRREVRFMEQTQGDLWRLIPCAIVLAILEEVLPLMVLYVPWLIPSTLILPSQSLRIRWEEEKKTRQGLGMFLKARSKEDRWDLAVLDRPQLVGLCKAMNLGTLTPTFWLRRRVDKKFEWLYADDRLLSRPKDFDVLTNEEKRFAASQRGMLSLRLRPPQVEDKLRRWFASYEPTAEPRVYKSVMLQNLYREAEENVAGEVAVEAEEGVVEDEVKKEE